METLKFNVFNFLNKSKKTTVPHLPLPCFDNLQIAYVQIKGAGTPEKRYSDAVKELKVVETYKKQNIVVNDVCFCSSAM